MKIYPNTRSLMNLLFLINYVIVPRAFPVETVFLGQMDYLVLLDTYLLYR